MANPTQTRHRPTTEPGRPVTTWSGDLTFHPSAHARPRDEADVVALVDTARDRGQGLRPIGAGHSSTPLAVTDDVVVSLERMRGLLEHDAATGTARVAPGTGLAELERELADVGLAMENLGDVDYQTITGAVSTGTHGTGERLGNLSSTVVGGRLVSGAGEVVPFGSEAEGEDDGELLRAAQVSLGALGILTSLTVRVRPAYELHRRNWMTHVDWVLEHHAELSAQHRHVDFYWYPRSDLAQVRVLDEPGAGGELVPPGTPRVDDLGPSYEVLPNQRELRFDEMEYFLPRDAVLPTFRAVRDRVKARHRATVAWRVLVRTVAADRAMLSTATGRPTGTIALLQNATLDHGAYFADLEPVLHEPEGRPHWGKKHTCAAPELARRYPEWATFRRWRRRLDPEGVLLNDHLRELLGEER